MLAGNSNVEAVMTPVLRLESITADAVIPTISNNVLTIESSCSLQELAIFGARGGQSRSAVPEKQGIGAIVKIES